MLQPKRRTTSAARNPARTRERILNAALREFAAHGFAGARVDAIAQRARTNKRMLYHYFHDKAGLFQVALHHKISQRVEIAERYPAASGPRTAAWFLATGLDEEWVRILCWESLQLSTGKALDEKSRRKIALAHIAGIRQQQTSGALNPKADADCLLLAMMSLAVFPHAFPQLTRLICGQPVTTKKFQQRYAAFLQQTAATFRP